MTVHRAEPLSLESFDLPYITYASAEANSLPRITLFQGEVALTSFNPFGHQYMTPITVYGSLCFGDSGIYYLKLGSHVLRHVVRYVDLWLACI